MDDRFNYTEILKTDRSGIVTSVIAHQELSGAPLRAVMWSNLHQAWIFAPEIAARLLYDDLNFDRLRNVDRTTAEVAAREALPAELPSEDELAAIAAEGERMGWDFGPPR
jgi:hypothetical protein